MEKQKNGIILGIDPGARQIGYALFNKNQLIFYGIKTIQQKTKCESLNKLRQILQTFFKNYKVKYIAIENPIFIQQKSSFIQTVFAEIKTIAESEQKQIFTYDPIFIRQAICQDKKPTKANTADYLIKKYPELKYYRNRPNLWQRRYCAMLFDAVAAGLVCVWKVEKNNQNLEE